jgi:hypothetical protein
MLIISLVNILLIEIYDDDNDTAVLFLHGRGLTLMNKNLHTQLEQNEQFLQYI